jgi:hypothetical protein
LNAPIVLSFPDLSGAVDQVNDRLELTHERLSNQKNTAWPSTSQFVEGQAVEVKILVESRS